ncbi:MAG: transposase [Candidatus Omnitrophica bacterium]|nr:transposase [Candidatus Omnitrophota bacterium]
MARPIRILFKGAYYHVMNRGHRKTEIYREDADYEKFIKIIKEACEIYKVKIIAYCLMTNHYHLLIHTPEANLPDFMKQVNGAYTQIFNKKYKYEGALFKGRYKAVVVQEGSYLLRLIRYIHRNPIKAGIVKNAKDYKYSSHGAYLEAKEEEWLRYKDEVKSQIKEKNFKQAYIDFMKKDDEDINKYLEDKSDQVFKSAVLGDQEYIDEIKEKYLKSERYYEEIPESRHIRAEAVIKRIKGEILKVFKIEEDKLYKSKRGQENIPRMIAICLARECSLLPHRQIGKIFGDISYKSSAIYCDRIKKKCLADKKLAKVYASFKVRCSQVET